MLDVTHEDVDVAHCLSAVTLIVHPSITILLLLLLARLALGTATELTSNINYGKIQQILLVYPLLMIIIIILPHTLVYMSPCYYYYISRIN